MGMMRQWEDVSKEGEKIKMRKMGGKSLQVKGVQRAPELLASQVLTKERSQRMRRRKVRW